MRPRAGRRWSAPPGRFGIRLSGRVRAGRRSDRRRVRLRHRRRVARGQRLEVVQPGRKAERRRVGPTVVTEHVRRRAHSLSASPLVRLIARSASCACWGSRSIRCAATPAWTLIDHRVRDDIVDLPRDLQPFLPDPPQRLLGRDRGRGLGRLAPRTQPVFGGDRQPRQNSGSTTLTPRCATKPQREQDSGRHLLPQPTGQLRSDCSSSCGTVAASMRPLRAPDVPRRPAPAASRSSRAGALLLLCGHDVVPFAAGVRWR
jgi:hypothetical protein